MFITTVLFNLKYYFLSHLETVKDVTKEFLRRNLIQTRQSCVGVVGNIFLFLIKFQRYNYIFKSIIITIFKWIKEYFQGKMIKKICFSSQINLAIGERPNKKNIESLNLTRKVKLVRL